MIPTTPDASPNAHRLFIDERIEIWGGEG